MPKVDSSLNPEDSALVQPHSNQVQTEHNISVTLRAAANFALAVKYLLVFTFFIHPVVTTGLLKYLSLF